MSSKSVGKSIGNTARLSIAAAFVAGIVGEASRAHAQLAAFPGALGYGASTTGARAAGSAISVYQVTNLSNSGSGSFRDAVSEPDRIIVFDVGGNIDLTSPVSCASNLTILGQTAPGQGIAVYGAETSFYGQSNDIVRYMRFMDTSLDPGGQGTSNSSGNCINLGNTTNMIFDHVSCEFASYNNIDASGTTGANNLTFQNSIVADPISDQQFNFHWEGTQSTFINNIFANASNRSILAKGNTQFVNNSIYNYQGAFTTGNSGGAFNFDIVNNYFVTGPSKTNNGNDNFFQVDSSQTAYAAGNLLDTNGDGTLNGNSDNSTGATVSKTPLLAGTSSLPTLSAAASYAWNAAHSGDSITHNASTYATSLGYDETDANVIATVNSMGTAGKIYGVESDDGITDGPTPGVGTITGGSIVSPNYSTLLNPEGYTEVEAWANGMSDSNLTPRVWTSTSGEWNTPTNWAAPTPLPLVAPGVYDIAYVQGNGSGSDGLVTVSTSANAYQLYIGGNGAAAGEKVQITGGNLTIYDTVTVGYANNATFEVDSGTATANNFQLGNTVGSTTYNGNLVLNGGTLLMQQIVLGGGSPSAWTTGGSISFNGGTVAALGTFNINAPATLQAGGGIINTNSNTGTVSGVFSGSGTLTINGGGTLTVTSNQTYTGITRISGATLSVSSLALSGSASPIGAATSAQGNIVLDGGTLQYIGAGGSTDHLFDLTANGGTLNASGSAAVTFSNTAVLSPTAAANVTLTLTGTNGNHNTFEPALADPAGGYTTSLTMAGTGLWDLSGGQKTYSGATTVLSGTLQTLSANNLSPNSSVTVAAGAALDFHGYSQTINALNGAGTISDNFEHSTDVLTIGAANGSGSFGGNLGAASLPNLVKTGTGLQVLAGTDTYTGTTTVSAGELQFNTAASIGGTGVSITVASGAAVAAGYAIDQTDFLNRITTASTGCAALAANSANNLNFSSTGANLASVSLGAVGSATYTGTLTPYSSTYLLGGGGGTLTLSNTNALTGGDNLQVVGQGVVQLKGTNNLTGVTTVGSGGVLAVGTLSNGGSASSIGANSNAAANIVLDGGTLRYIGTVGTTTDRSFTLTANGGTLDGSGTSGDGIDYDSPNPVAFTGTGNRTLTLAGTESHSNFDMAIGDPTSGQTSVTVNTASRWLWTTTSATYSGNTTVLAGELELYGGSSGGQLPEGTGKGNVLVNTGATLYLTGSTGINGLSDGPGGGGTVSDTSGALTLGNANASGSFSGAITGAMSLFKTGTGNQILSGPSLSYTGSTTISGGMLTLNATSSAAAITASQSITVDGGCTLQLISVAASGSTLQMLPSSSTVNLVTTGGSPLLQLNLNGGQQPVNSLELNGVAVPAGMYSATSAPSGETNLEQYFSGNGTLVVAVPEPAVGGTLTVLFAAGITQRRRRRPLRGVMRS